MFFDQKKTFRLTTNIHDVILRVFKHKSLCKLNLIQFMMHHGYAYIFFSIKKSDTE